MSTTTLASAAAAASSAVSTAVSSDRALVTGASGGIGSEICRRLLRSGVRVMVLMGRGMTELESVQRSLEETDPACSVTCIECDMSQTASVDAAVQKALAAVEYFTIVVHSAGVLGHGAIAESSIAAWDACVAVNIASVIHLTQLMSPVLLSAPETGFGKSIVFISSFAGVVPIKNAGAYCASKSAIRAFSHAIFEDLRESNIKVSVICPGTVNTALVNTRPNCIPSLMLQPEDIADTVLFVVRFPSRGCPTEIVLRPTATPYNNAR
eukprot:ANDGO_04667.mRNA.1 putative oxidoreductase SSP0419